MEKKQRNRITRWGKKDRSGFTLIELLVVIAIISLLVSILLPSLGKAKDLTKAAMCGVQTRNIALAYLLYREDWEHLPWTCWREEKPGTERIGVGHLTYLRMSVILEMEKGGLDPLLAFRCPADPDEPTRWWGWGSSGLGPPAPWDPKNIEFEVFMADDYATYTYLDEVDLSPPLVAAYPDEVNDPVASHNNLTSGHAMVGCKALSMDNRPPILDTFNHHENNTTYGGYNTAYGDAHVEWNRIPDEFYQSYPPDSAPSYTAWQVWYYWWD